MEKKVLKTVDLENFSNDNQIDKSGKNNNIYLPDYRGLNYKLAEYKLDSLGFMPEIVYQD